MILRTIGDYLNYWLNKVISVSVRQSTYTAYRGYIVNHLQRYIGNLALKELSTEHLQEVVCALQEKRLANKSVQSIMLMLKSALKYAIDYGYMQKNPCDMVRLPQLEEREIIVFDAKKQRRLEQTIAQSMDNRDYGVLICLYTGIRIGELCGLKWNCIDFAQSTMEIKNSLNRITIYEDNKKKTILSEVLPKTKKSRRKIPLPLFLCQLLNTLKKSSNSEYVISMKNGNPVEPRMMQFVYCRLLERAKIAHVSFHTLRHTFATRAIESGADVKTVSEILGHTNTMITLNRYTHSLFEQKKKLMANLNTLYNKTGKLTE